MKAQGLFSTVYVLSFIFLILQGCSKNTASVIPEKPMFFVKGETITLSSQLTSYPLKKDAKITSVYKIGAGGSVKTYKSGSDYLLTKDGGIQRTVNSAIPDFSTYNVIFDSNGMFSYTPQNPPFPFFWQVMIDYTIDTDSTIHSQSLYLSDTLKSKILSKKDLSIYSIGTSITAGANTAVTWYGQVATEIYPNFVGRALNKLYGNLVTVTNLAVGGATSELLTANVTKIKADKPDLVFIEFGMNEHDRSKNMDEYLDNIEVDVKSIKASGIDCVIVGFLQQNPKWNNESYPRSVYFNLQLNEIAKRNGCFFADIYKAFGGLPQTKLYTDILADYIHHPTEFGQKIYYLTTMPVFLFDDNVTETKLLSFIQQ